MTTDFYDKVVVKIKYKGIFGSGILISDMEKKHSYLISAWHCFEKQFNIDYLEVEIFRQEENELKQIFLNFKDKIIIEQNDIIILEINYIQDIPQYQIVRPEIGDQVAFIGFPNGLSGEECMTHRYIIWGKINDFPNHSIIQVNSDRSFETYVSDAKSNVSAYSGCGIFVKSGEMPYLCGIVTELGSSEGLFAFVNGISALVIDNVLYQQKNIHLPNAKWSSFESFIESTLTIFEEPLANICSVQIPEIIENVTPGSILEHCGNKIVWPYSNKSILKQEVWEEWLLYLIIRSIESRNNVKNEGFYVIKNEVKNRKVKVLYATNHIKLPEFLKDYLENAYQDISPGQIMVIKTEKTPAAKRLSSNKIEKIISNISSAIGMKNNIYIDTVENNIRQMSVIHIDALVDEMNNFIVEHENEELKVQDLEKKLGERIVEVLYGI